MRITSLSRVALSAASCAAALLACSAMTPASAAGVSAWPTYGGDLANTRFANLDQINASNVGALIPVWVFQTGVVGSDEGTPLVVGDTMYVTTGKNDSIIALDAMTGKLKWRHETPLGFTALCCGTNNRGVAVDGGTVFYATLDGHLVALDAANGKQLWSVRLGEPKDGFSETQAPLVWNGKVYIGSAGGEYGIRGSLTAYSETDGKEIWRWWSVSPGWEGNYVTEVHGVSLNRDIAAEKAAAAKWSDAWQHGGGPVWMTPALDPATGTIYASTGNPAPQLLGAERPGDNLYTDSIVALDANTGAMKWAYQQTPHDLWDYDATSPPLLFDVTGANGAKEAAVGEAGKTGWFYILDRKSGHLLTLSQPFVPQMNLYQMPGPNGITVEPGSLGGANWSPTSYNPDLGLAYIAAVVLPRIDKPIPYIQWKTGGQRWAGSHEVNAPGEKSAGTFTAIDVSTGKIAWQDKTDVALIGGSMALPELTFVGEGDGNFDAMDAKTGKILWQFQTGAGISAAPIAYELDGREYVAVQSGGNALLGTPPGDDVIVFALPEK
ncbi:MAG: pyrroloquinoline quinone-dependent dehydrogenase [Acetobacteraceae bacterium]